MSNTSRSQTAPWFRLGIAMSAAAALAACSADASRFADSPRASQTASVPNTASTGGNQVSSGAIQNSSLPPANTTWQDGQRAGTASAGTVTVRPGQTLYSIARANGTDVDTLARANGIAPPYSVKVGQRIRVPGVASPTSPAPSFSPQQASYQPAPTRNFSGRGSVHKVQPGETLFSLGRKYDVGPYRIAEHNGLDRNHQLTVGQRIRIPGNGASQMAAAPSTLSPPRATTPNKVDRQEQTSTRAAAVAPPPLPEAQLSAPPPREQSQAAGFRWPVRGRVISAFGPKPNGTRNEGINIAVPAGTSIRAAESGVVAYSGNELKGYGNLVLIRHENGWVTAYAHASELLVKRGDRVKRGEIIAKAGQTGSVKSPQLHFELRKGASAVDPLKHLATATASN